MFNIRTYVRYIYNLVTYLLDTSAKISSFCALGGSHSWSFLLQHRTWPVQDLVLQIWNLSGVLGSSTLRQWLNIKRNQGLYTVWSCERKLLCTGVLVQLWAVKWLTNNKSNVAGYKLKVCTYNHFSLPWFFGDISSISRCVFTKVNLFLSLSKTMIIS